MKKVNILTHDNGVGLSQDVKIMINVLKGFDVKFFDIRLPGHRVADINVFLEVIDPKRFNQAKVNIFIPNPEWFWEVQYVSRFDLILAKTHDCEKIFSRLGAKAIEFTSFTSEDRWEEDVIKERMFLHLAGKSETKGSEHVFNAFNRNGMPEIIFLKYINHNKYHTYTDNIIAHFERLPLDILINLQNKCAFHLCTSSYEGFGHYIWEAKSAGGIIITTNAAPMNEMVNESNGFLIPGHGIKKFNHGILTGIDANVLAKRCQEIYQMPHQDLMKMSYHSRQSWVDNDRFFRTKINEIFNNL